MKSSNLEEGLARFLRENPDLPSGDDLIPAKKEPDVKTGNVQLHVAVEKKGRGGKTATIIYGLEGFPAEEVAALAADMKKHLGTGGSWRDEEILLQGDRRRDVVDYLKQKGYKVK